MAKQNGFSVQESALTQPDSIATADVSASAKKQFIEPEISLPIDVLEATTFFQTITSGGTN